MNTEKYLRIPKNEPSLERSGRFEKYALQENPFPSSPFINPRSNDARSNGDIYEPTIRNQEFLHIKKNFLETPKSDPNHLRLGYIMDTSYIGRGNGKSAFLLNLQRKINHDFCAELSNDVNKCFSISLVPEPGGKTKTFERFVDLFAQYIFSSGIIEDCLVTLRLKALISLDNSSDTSKYFTADEDLKELLLSEKWFSEHNKSVVEINNEIRKNKFLSNLPDQFPLIDRGTLFSFVKPQDFKIYYESLKRGKPKTDFVFSDLVYLFLSAGFNGAYIFIDDYERIPDFQSERQKRDFAIELRTTLFDGLYTNAKFGFYTFILVFHAGVPRLIQSSWDQSGLEQRAPIYSLGSPKHVILFEKINLDKAISLVKKYLKEYHIEGKAINELHPFTKTAIKKIAELSEYNASRILKMSYDTLEKAVENNKDIIDEKFITDFSAGYSFEEPKPVPGIKDTPTKDMMKGEDNGNHG